MYDKMSKLSSMRRIANKVCFCLIITIVCVVLYNSMNKELDSETEKNKFEAEKTQTRQKIPPTNSSVIPPTNSSVIPPTNSSVITIALVLCNSKDNQFYRKKTEIQFRFRRQIEQTIVLIKSALALSKEFLRFVIVADTQKTFNVLYDAVEREFSEYYRRKFQMDLRLVWYPPATSFGHKEFRPCGAERMFFVKVLKSYDSVIYMDTDTIFMNSPVLLWNEFSKFNDSQMISLAPPLSNDNIKRGLPIYKDVGLNSGIILFNLTRMQNFPGGFIETALGIIPLYIDRMALFDQDLFNIIFSQPNHTKYFYELNCSWNYRSSMQSRCIIDGASVIHGLIAGFHKIGNVKKALYDCWKNYELGKSLMDLVNKMEESMQKCTNPKQLLYHFHKTDFLLKNLFSIAFIKQ